jgi:predicted ester cyclase
MRLLLTLAALAAATPACAAQVDDRAAIAIAKPQELIVAKDLPAATVAAMLKPVDAFYGFWNNGSGVLLDAALSRRFVDHTLPKGRPQGPAGPAAASKAFLGAVPDLKIAVVQRMVVGDRVVSHLHFTGHFTGTFMGKNGTGQPIDFIATDILRVAGGRITDNWHLEDNLTFQQQIGLVPAG